MEKSSSFDYLICLSMETTRTQGDYREKLENGQEQLLKRSDLLKDSKFPNIIEFDWISYCLEDMKPERERTQHFVKPTNMEHLNSKTLELTGVTQNDIDGAGTLESVLEKFQDFITNSFVLKNKSYCIITFGNFELGYQLGIEATRKKINLDSCFSNFFNLSVEFKKGHPNHLGPISKIEHLLDALKLKNRKDVINALKVSETNCTNIVRVVHRMCREGHRFVNPLDVKSILPADNPDNPPDNLKEESKDTQKEIEESKDKIKSETNETQDPQDNVKAEIPLKAEPVDAPAPALPIPSHEVHTHPEVPGQMPPQSMIDQRQEQRQSIPDRRDGGYYDNQYNYKEEAKDYPHHSGRREVDEYQPIDSYNPPMHEAYNDRRRERPNYAEQTMRGYHNRERSPVEPRRFDYGDDNSIKYVKVRYLPPDCDQNKIIDFFGSIPIANANIALVFDQTGSFCQEAVLALNSSQDQIEALQQSGRYIFNYQIVVQEADSREWERAQQSQKLVFTRQQKILVRMRGLPFTVKKEEVIQFFEGFDIFPNSVIIGELSNGKKTGEGVILFKSEEEAARAVNEKNGASIGRRWIELYLHPYSHFHNFFQAQHHEEFVCLNKFVTDENKFRTLRVRGLPYSATKKDIVSFFHDYGVTNNDVVFEIKDGRPTGKALVFMMDSQTCLRAIGALHKEYIGKRYVELEQVSNLPHEF